MLFIMIAIYFNEDFFFISNAFDLQVWHTKLACHNRVFIVQIVWYPLEAATAQYLHQNSKLLALVVCFAELVFTGLWIIWAHALYTWFLPRPDKKESNVTLAKTEIVYPKNVGALVAINFT